jgi:protein-tyrosine phosphatase
VTPAPHDFGSFDPSGFELVLLCTGNRARSPIAEGFLRQLLRNLPVRVHSLGTLELGGAPPLPEAVKASAAAGLDITHHRARALRGNALCDADLVLGFERHHVSAAVIDGGARQERVFLLPELVALIHDEVAGAGCDPLERARETIARAHARRDPTNPPVSAELGDPLGQRGHVYRETVERIRDLSVRLAVGLFGVTYEQPVLVPQSRHV